MIRALALAKVLGDDGIHCDADTGNETKTNESKFKIMSGDYNKVYFPLPAVKENLEAGRFETLPLFSRALRQAVLELDKSLDVAYRISSGSSVVNDTINEDNDSSKPITKLQFIHL